MNFWIENDSPPPPFWNISENSSNLVASPGPKTRGTGLTARKKWEFVGTANDET